MLDHRDVTLFDALQAFFRDHQYPRRSRRRRRGRPRLGDVLVRGGDQPERGPWLIRADAALCWCASRRSA